MRQTPCAMFSRRIVTITSNNGYGCGKSISYPRSSVSDMRIKLKGPSASLFQKHDGSWDEVDKYG